MSRREQVAALAAALGARALAARQRTAAALRASRYWLAEYRAELLAAAALVAGWSLITAGVAALTSPLAWLFSAGTFLISLFGWELLYTVGRRGLYALTRKPADG